MKMHQPVAHSSFETSLGMMRLAASVQGLSGAWFVQGQKDCPDISGWGEERSDHEVLAQAMCEINDFLAGKRNSFDVPLDLSAGTPFQQAVWRALIGIPFGSSCSYGQIAAVIGRSGAVRAVGTAVGANPISIIVPCHRVLGGNGSLTGYSGGLSRKAALLRVEGWAMEHFVNDELPRHLRPLPPGGQTKKFDWQENDGCDWLKLPPYS